MKKIYIIISIIIISIIAVIVIVNVKERRKGKNVDANNIIINNEEEVDNNEPEEVTDIVTTRYRGETIQITKQKDIDTIKDILLNLKFKEGTTDSYRSFTIGINNEEYTFKNRGKTTIKGKGAKEEAYLSEEDSNKIINILNEYINEYFKEEKGVSNRTLDVRNNVSIVFD